MEFHLDRKRLGIIVAVLLMLFVIAGVVIACVLGVNGEDKKGGPIVHTKSGPVQGWTYRTSDGTDVNIFQGIPFAKPPVGILRFEKPVPPTPWTSPLETKSFAPGCAPCIKEFADFDGGRVSEDCLYLNVWTPAEKAQSLLPVAFYIHGGGYYGGSAQGYDSSKFSEIYARRGIVVVTIQYRLAQFGYLTLNDSRLVPNIGLWDQNMALKWVHDNVEQFGGDPNHVTIWGESAGSSSVSQQTLSPHSKGLFHQSILMSGSFFSAFARGTHNVEYSKKVIAEVGCDNRTDMKKCLQGKTVEELQDAAEKNGACLLNDVQSLGFAPIIDGDFFPDRPENLVKNAPKVPTIFGLNQVEGRGFALFVERDDNELNRRFPFSIGSKEWSKYNETSFRLFIDSWVLGNHYGERAKEVSDEIFNFYAQNKPDNNANEFWLQQFVRIVSDFMFNIPEVREAVEKERAGFPVYAFKLDYYNQAIWPAKFPVQGSTHTCEYPYVFEMKANFNYSADDNKVKNTIQQGIISFLKTGVPTLTTSTWSPFTKTMEYLSLKPASDVQKDLFGDSYRFWTETMKKYPFDFITQEGWW